MREDESGDTYVPNLLSVKVKSVRQLLGLIRRGAENRAVRHTDMNTHSSRSHALLQLRLELRPRGDMARVTRAKVNFVDLAGSERWKVGHVG